MKELFVKWSIVGTSLLGSINSSLACGKGKINDANINQELLKYFQKKCEKNKSNITEKVIKNLIKMGEVLCNNIKESDISTFTDFKVIAAHFTEVLTKALTEEEGAEEEEGEEEGAEGGEEAAA